MGGRGGAGKRKGASKHGGIEHKAKSSACILSDSLKQARQLSILSFCVRGGQAKRRPCTGFRNTPTTPPSDNSPRLTPASSGESLSQVQPRLDFSGDNEDKRNDCNCVTTRNCKDDEDHANNCPSILTERPQCRFQQEGDDHQTHAQHESNYSGPSTPLDQEIDAIVKSTETSQVIANTSSLDARDSFNNIHNATTHDNEGQLMKPTKNKPLSQLFLDFGQSSFGVRTLCETCGMLYDKHLPEDVRQHVKVCRNYELGVPFQSPEGRIVARFQSSGNIFSSMSGIGDHVVGIRPSDSTGLLKKLAQVQQIVDQELGAAPAHDGTSTTTSSNSRSQDRGNRKKGCAEPNEKRRRKNNLAQSTTGADSTTSNARSVATTAYLYIRDRRVVGLVTVETIRYAYRAKNQWERHLNPERATMGIRHLWVHSRARNMGIATRMVDSARCKLVFGLVIPRDEIAFSSPTQSGLLFAQKYCGFVRSKPDSARSGDDVDFEDAPVGTNKSNEDMDTAERSGNILVYQSTASEVHHGV